MPWCLGGPKNNTRFSRHCKWPKIVCTNVYKSCMLTGQSRPLFGNSISRHKPFCATRARIVRGWQPAGHCRDVSTQVSHPARRNGQLLRATVTPPTLETLYFQAFECPGGDTCHGNCPQKSCSCARTLANCPAFSDRAARPHLPLSPGEGRGEGALEAISLQAL